MVQVSTGVLVFIIIIIITYISLGIFAIWFGFKFIKMKGGFDIDDTIFYEKADIIKQVVTSMNKSDDPLLKAMDNNSNYLKCKSFIVDKLLSSKNKVSLFDVIGFIPRFTILLSNKTLNNACTENPVEVDDEIIDKFSNNFSALLKSKGFIKAALAFDSVFAINKA